MKITTRHLIRETLIIYNSCLALGSRLVNSYVDARACDGIASSELFSFFANVSTRDIFTVTIYRGWYV